MKTMSYKDSGGHARSRQSQVNHAFTRDVSNQEPHQISALSTAFVQQPQRLGGAR